MITQIDFISKSQAEELKPFPHIAIISIADPDENVNLKKGFHSILSLRFLDIEYAEDPSAFSRDMGLEIFDFVMGLHDNQPFDDFHLAVHCHAGISRSAAVALAVHAMTGCGFRRNNQNQTCFANKLVVSTMSEIIGKKIQIPDEPVTSDGYPILLWL